MNYYIIASAFLVAMLFAFLFAALSNRQGPWRAVVLFFFIIFLVGWAGQLWITPFGPIILGISWLPLIFVAVIFSFLIIAISPPAKPPVKAESDVMEKSAFEIGMFFWFLIILLITAIVVGYYKIPPVVDGINLLQK